MEKGRKSNFVNWKSNSSIRDLVNDPVEPFYYAEEKEEYERNFRRQHPIRSIFIRFGEELRKIKVKTETILYHRKGYQNPADFGLGSNSNYRQTNNQEKIIGNRTGSRKE